MTLRTTTIAVSCLLAALAAAPVAGAVVEPGRGSGGSAPASTDADRDKVFDDLEARLAGMGEDQRVRVIVTLRDAATEQRVAGLERAVGGFSVKRRFQIVDAFAGTVTKGQVRALARRPEVVQVEEDSIVRALNDSAQSSFGVTKARIDAPTLDGDADGNLATYSKDDLVAAVIDTGIDAGHADLDEGKVIGFAECLGNKGSCVEKGAYDDNGHGTHVAGTIAGEGDALLAGTYKGVAPAGALVGVKVLDKNGSGYTSDVIAGIDWAVAKKATYGIEAINLSLGSSGCSNGDEADSKAVDNAHDAGLVVAVAAGNEGPGTCTVGSPGGARKALTVGAMADMGEAGFFQAYFSSRGKTKDGRIKPDVSAPGWKITSAKAGSINGYETYSGTSMATPFIAGVALLMRDVKPSLTSQQVKDKVMQTAVDWARGGDNKTSGTAGADIDYGAGRLDAYAALASAGAPLSSPPPMPQHQLIEGSMSGKGDVDDYAVNVADVSFPVAATLIISDLTDGSSTTTNFDLYLYDPDGNLVDDSTYRTRQEEVYFKPTSTGTYTLRVKSANGSGPYFVDLSAGLGADITPPQTTIDSGPSGPTNDSTPTFSFSSSEPGSSFECKVDTGSFSSCSSPHTTSTLADGPHTFQVRAIDAAGNVDPTPASQSFSVDTAAPDTTITSGPSGTVNSSSASFEFTSSESGSTFKCKLDSGSWESCTSPKSYSGLSDGSHTFYVEATDAAGNPDPTPASQTWTVDTDPPDVTLTSPSNGSSTKDTTPTFSGAAGTASGDSSTVTVKIKNSSGTVVQTLSTTQSGGSWSVDASSALAEGTYTAQAEQSDAAGNVGQSSSNSFTVDTTAPDTTITSGPSGTVNSSSASFEFTSTESGSSFKCKLDSGSWESCSSPKSYSGLSDGSHTFEVQATDAAGNPDATPASRTWTVDTSSTSSGGGTGDSGGSSTTTEPAPSSGPAPSSSEPAPSSSPAETAPLSAVVSPLVENLRTSLSRGVTLSVACTSACRVGTTLLLSRRTARRVGIAARSRYVRVGRGAARLSRAGKAKVVARFTRKARSRLRRLRSVSLVVQTSVRDAGGKTRVTKRRLKLSRGVSLRSVLRRGLGLSVGCSTDCQARGSLLLARRTARRLGLSVSGRHAVVGRGSTRLSRAGERRLSVKFTRAARRALPRLRTVKLTLLVTLANGQGKSTSSTRSFRFTR